MPRLEERHTDKKFYVLTEDQSFAIRRIYDQAEIAVTNDIKIAVRLTELLNSYGEEGVSILDK